MEDKKKIRIEVDYLKTANYALTHNRIPICRGVELTNISETPMEDVRIRCSGEFVTDHESQPIGRIDPGETVRVSPFNVAPDPKELASITERAVTQFTLTATSNGETVGEATFELELMPYDHWTGTGMLPQTIASFITPNHPAINALVLKSAAALKKLTGSSSLTAYQTGDPRGVRQQVAAVFAAMHEEGIAYRPMAASYETIGQRVTLPDETLAYKIANCIEITLLMASVLEAIGINCIVIFQKEHAYLGVWLVDDCYTCSVCDDPAFIEKSCSKGIGDMLVIECTQATQEKASFEEALRIAERNLADHSQFEIFVDVKRSRLERILPLPTRIEADGKWIFDTKGIDHDSCDLDVKEHDRYDLNNIAATGKNLTKFDIWERKLLDFSLRNTLLNLSLRRRAVQFISFDVNRVEDHLQDGNEYRIAAKPDVDIHTEAGTGLVRSKLHEHIHDLISNDIEHHLLHTYLPEGETKTVLKTIYRAARNAIEESGANSLFLAIGTLRWYETEHSTTPRHAPLLLLPVEMVYKKGNYYIRTRDEDISLNITLMEFLRQNFDINIKGLSPLPLDDSGVDVPLIFALIRDALKEQKRWDVEEECLLGIFSFSKFLMWNDVHNHRDQLSDNNIIGSLIANRLTWKPDFTASDLREIDRTVAPAETAIPVAVDSSQMAAVIEGGAGNSFILYGPPGTGKSQTITNLIANALYHGKRVLFVAEKMAALSVVQSRLAKIGLDAFCLELHSNKSTKRHVLQQLEKALKVVHIKSPSDFARHADKIFERRKELLAYIEALHAKDPADGLSAYDCILRSESIDATPLPGFRHDKEVDLLIAMEGHKGIDELLGSRLPTVMRLTGQPSKHPLKGLHPDRAMLSDPQKASKEMMEDSKAIYEYINESSDLKEARQQRETLMRDNAPTILEEDPNVMQQEWREAKAKWFIPRFFAKRKFVKKVRVHNPTIKSAEIDHLLDELASYRKRHIRITDLNRIIEKRSDKHLGTDEVPETAYLRELIEHLTRWADNTSQLRDWIHWKEFCADLRKNGMGCVEEILESVEMNPAEVNTAFQKALYLHKANDKTSRQEALATFEGTLFDEKTAAYRRLADEFQQLTRKELYARLASRVPRVTDNANSGSEIGLLNRNISNGGRGMSLRDLFDQLPTLMPRLCPVMLMSPMSVAQYIDLTADKFDLVVFDEASQMPTSEAVGAIARGKSLIVVGDPKQMPPTSFFSSTNVDEEEASIDDMESILEDCRTLEIPSLQLSWHYRSRHESLIAFSNNEYYEGTLITFPSTDDKTTKVHFVPVEGHYEKGGRRCNQAEAKAIVDEIERRLRNEQLRKESIGVIAFSVMQQGLIEDLLQERIEQDKELQEFAASMYEPIFVKNLENVQGDERDVILFSIGYGPDKEGKISMNFGPLNNSGGERRLNVAVSRARKEMYVFSTLKSADIDLRRTKALGVEGLKHFLQYAETQSLPSTSRGQSGHKPSLIADLIVAELEKHGYKATANVGRSQFRVDVAVERNDRPGVFSLGILLDGYGYRDTLTTRDREVVQPSVLQGLDWNVMRVWSVDWLRNRARVIDRILEALRENEEGNTETPTEEPVALFDVTKEKEIEKETNAKEYSQYAPHPRETAHIPDADLVRNIIAHEQPITFMQLCRRFNAIKGTARVTQTLQKTLKGLLGRYHMDPSGAIWLTQKDSTGYDSYRINSGRDITETPEAEIVNAIIETVKEQLAIDEDALMLLAAKKMGFTRRGANVDAAFRKALESQKVIGRLENVGSNVRMREVN